MRDPAASIRSSLAADGFVEVGCFAVEAKIFSYQFSLPEAREWLFSVYAWVSLAPPCTVLRIGKCHGPLRIRIGAYKASLDDAMSGRLGPNEHFLNDTQPWEREGWVGYASAPVGGVIYARRITAASEAGRAGALADAERALIAAYDPPLCGVSKAGKARKQTWVAQHGLTVVDYSVADNYAPAIVFDDRRVVKTMFCKSSIFDGHGIFKVKGAETSVGLGTLRFDGLAEPKDETPAFPRFGEVEK